MNIDRIRVLSILVFSSIIVGYVVQYLNYRYGYSKELPYYPVKGPKDPVLTIGIIGDSWVFGEKLDTILQHELLKEGIDNSIVSLGSPGASTKYIYQSMYQDPSKEFSTRTIIEKRPDYCIVISGVNDAVKHTGRDFYAHHMTLIVKTLLHYNIEPIIVSIPEYNFAQVLDEMNFIGKSKNIISAYFTDHGELDNVRTYRKELNVSLKNEHLRDSVLMIDFDLVCRDFKDCLDLYSNALHLSTPGNEKLSKVIAKELIEELDAGRSDQNTLWTGL